MCFGNDVQETLECFCCSFCLMTVGLCIMHLKFSHIYKYKGYTCVLHMYTNF